MFVEILYHALMLDLQWFAELLLGNLFWLFAFIAIAFYFFGGGIKNVLIATLILALDIFVWVDFGTAIGIPLFVGSFLLLNYIIKLGALSFAVNHPVSGFGFFIFFSIAFIELIFLSYPSSSSKKN